MQTSEGESSVDSLREELQLGSDSARYDKSYDSVLEFCTYESVILLKAADIPIGAINTKGSLLMTRGPGPRIFSIEWRDEGYQMSEQDSFVVVNETRSPTRGLVIRVAMTLLKSVEVLNENRTLRLVSHDNRTHSKFEFERRNADQFVRSLQRFYKLQLSNRYRNTWDCVSPHDSVTQGFADFQLFDHHSDHSTAGGLLPRFREQAINVFAKIGNIVAPMPMSPENAEYHTEVRQSHQPTVNNEAELEKEPRKHAPQLPKRQMTPRGAPLSEQQWKEFQMADGRFSDIERVLQIIFRGGVTPSLRPDVWKYLLGYYHWNDTTEERSERRRVKAQEYELMKQQWLTMTVAQENNFTDYRDRKSQIEKDVKRTDRTTLFFAGDNNPNLESLHSILMTYVMYNFDLGYVQGMNDLLAPILCVMGDEVDAFWCFVGFMDRVFTNFDFDQAGMKRQLAALAELIKFINPKLYAHLVMNNSEGMHFCFRWLIVWFKREFDAFDVIELWEVIWTGLPGINFHLFFCVAILDAEANFIIEQEYGLNEILKHVNDLALQIDLKTKLEAAEAIYQQVQMSAKLNDELRIIIGEEPSKSDSVSDEEDVCILDRMQTPLPESPNSRMSSDCDRAMSLSFL